ncbi:MAG: winged helix DNA-binding protein [Betaproteobacteria bacterium]|nr:winged helix DNA-binding protein [Betaproteobacteria bacterium]
MSRNRDRNIVLTTLCLHALRTIQLNKPENLVLWNLATNLAPAGDVISNAELGRELSVDTAHITRAMKRLCELGFLMRGPKVGVSYHYKLNPAYFRIIS